MGEEEEERGAFYDGLYLFSVIMSPVELPRTVPHVTKPIRHWEEDVARLSLNRMGWMVHFCVSAILYIVNADQSVVHVNVSASCDRAGLLERPNQPHASSGLRACQVFSSLM